MFRGLEQIQGAHNAGYGRLLNMPVSDFGSVSHGVVPLLMLPPGWVKWLPWLE